MATGLAKTSTYLAIFITALTSVLWISLIMQEKGWAAKVTAYYTVETGAWQVSVSQGVVAKMILPAKLTQFLSFMKPAVRNTEDFAEWLCGIAHYMVLVSDICWVGKDLHFASMGLIACVFFGTFMNWCGAAMLAMWAFMKPRESVRLWARIIYFLTFAIYTGGLCQYIAVASRLRDLPPESDQVTFGPNCIAASALCIIQLIPLFLVLVFVGRTLEEAKNEHSSYQKKQAREETRLQNQMYFAEASYGDAGANYGAAGTAEPGYANWGQDAAYGQPAAAYGQPAAAYGQTDAAYGQRHTGMLQHTGRLMPHTGSLLQHTGRLLQHTGRLMPHTGSLLQHTGRLLQHTGRLMPHTGSLLQHTGRLLQHTGRLMPHTGSLLQQTGGLDK
ncbi:unnamed protein product [Effrenium voratum]|uniref:Uncharacterized protein n=1 Tax=Effrenium voratum TaxID=2562239 RepID=A0AA36HKT2_9DINO|nr:unnamed protein product [Effrenium voratum]